MGGIEHKIGMYMQQIVGFLILFTVIMSTKNTRKYLKYQHTAV